MTMEDTENEQEGSLYETAQMLGTVCTWGFSQEEPSGATAGKGRQPS